MSNFREELEMWIDLWNDGKGEEAHPKPEKPKTPSYSDDIMSHSVQDLYYDYFDSDAMLSEEKVQNPIYPDSVGKDQDGPEPVWVDEKLLKEVEGLKNRLFKVENEMARLGQGKKPTTKPVSDRNGKLMAEVKSLRKQIDSVSNQLGIKNEPSPYNTGRK